MSARKHQLYKFCQAYVDEKIGTVQSAIRAAQQDVAEETKSSAGDKYETARAMMHLEIEKLSGQLAELSKTKKMLDQINPDQAMNSVQSGSVVETSIGNYFMSISAGQYTVDGDLFYCISPVSPIGMLLHGKHAGDTFQFRSQRGTIMRVS